MEYTQSQPDDEAAHKKFHEKFVNGAPMPECKSESVVQRLADGSRIILIRASSEVQLGRGRTAIEPMQPDIGPLTPPPKLFGAAAHLCSNRQRKARVAAAAGRGDRAAAAARRAVAGVR